MKSASKMKSPEQNGRSIVPQICTYLVGIRRDEDLRGTKPRYLPRRCHWRFPAKNQTPRYIVYGAQENPTTLNFPLTTSFRTLWRLTIFGIKEHVLASNAGTRLTRRRPSRLPNSNFEVFMSISGEYWQRSWFGRTVFVMYDGLAFELERY